MPFKIWVSSVLHLDWKNREWESCSIKSYYYPPLIFSKEKVSSHWVPESLSLGKSFNFEASSVLGHSSIDSPGLFIQHKHVSVGACEERSSCWKTYHYQPLWRETLCTVWTHTWSLWWRRSIVLHENLAKLHISSLDLVPGNVDHQPMKPFSSFGILPVSNDIV